MKPGRQFHGPLRDRGANTVPNQSSAAHAERSSTSGVLHARPVARDVGPRLSELLDDLLWPRLLRAGSLALRPERLQLAFLVNLLALGVLWVPTIWGANPLDAVFVSAGPGPAPGWRIPGTNLHAAPERLPVGAIPFLALAVAVLSVGGCGLCRMAACDFSQGVILSWPQALGFALARWKSVLTAVFGPPILVGVIAAGLAVGGVALFSLPVVDLLGGLLYGLMLVAAIAGVGIALVYSLGKHMLVPAVACDGADGFDAIGRAYPYVLGRPLRLVVYSLLLGAVGAVVVVLAFAIAQGAAVGCARAAAYLAGARADAILGTGPGTPTGTAVYVHRLVAIWTTALELGAWAVVTSYYFCASTLLYLAMRQVNVGQDIAEIWMPGMIEGTMAQAMAGRAAIGAAAGSTRPGAPIAGDDD